MIKKPKRENSDLKPLGDILAKFDWDHKKYISVEFQDYGFRLAEELGDIKHKALYIKLAKELPRARLEEAKNFVKGAYQVKNPGSLFMWKLKQMKGEKVIRKT